MRRDFSFRLDRLSLLEQWLGVDIPKFCFNLKKKKIYKISVVDCDTNRVVDCVTVAEFVEFLRTSDSTPTCLKPKVSIFLRGHVQDFSYLIV